MSSPSLDLVAQGSGEELEHEVGLSAVGAIVEEGEDDSLHEAGGLVLGHEEDQLCQVLRLRL